MASKFALVIANTEYQDASFAKLTAPGKDAEEFAKVLEDPELANFGDVQILINEGEGPTRRSIARFFANRKPEDLLLLYFSGHGVRNEQGQLFLAANDTEIGLLDATGIRAEFITRAMNNSRSQRQLLILDCCNSGAFAHGSKTAYGVGKSMGIASAFEGSGFGHVVLTATDATQYAWEGDKIIGDTQKSVFTHFLIEGLKGDADRNGDGRIDVDELYDYAFEQVVRITPKQTPGKWSYKQQGDIILRENLKPRNTKAISDPPKRPLQVFLLHTSVDKPRVLKLYSYLKQRGVQPWMDDKNLLPGHDLKAEISKALSSSDAIVVCLSKSSVEAEGYVQKEIPFVLDKVSERQESTTLIVPAKLEECEVPTRLSQYQSVELFRERGHKRLMLSLKQHANNLGPSIAQAPVPDETMTPTAIDTIPPIADEQEKVSLPNPTEENTEIQKEEVLKVKRSPYKKFVPYVIIGVVFVLLLSLLLPLRSPFGASRSAQATSTNLASTELITVPPQSVATPTSDVDAVMTGNDNMILVYVPEGEFTMGSNAGGEVEKPVHKVRLDAFWIDKTEITNTLYQKCVDARKCEEPGSNGSNTRSSYYGNPEFDNYPVINVSWNDANAYCLWAGRRLPTEAEWEKAARGTDARTFPWGNSEPTPQLANYNQDQKTGDTTEAGKYPAGASPYGALDMAGNVWEWVADWYGETYYAVSPPANPLGPDSGQERVARGGSLFSADVRSTQRQGYFPGDKYISYGFRCAVSAAP